MFWYWYIVVTNFVFGIGAIVLINKPRRITSAGEVAFDTLLKGTEIFAFWRIYDDKFVVIPLIVTIYGILNVAYSIYMIDNPPRRMYYTTWWVLVTRIVPALTIIGATVLYNN